MDGDTLFSQYSFPRAEKRSRFFSVPDPSETEEAKHEQRRSRTVSSQTEDGKDDGTTVDPRAVSVGVQTDDVPHPSARRKGLQERRNDCFFFDEEEVDGQETGTKEKGKRGGTEEGFGVCFFDEPQKEKKKDESGLKEENGEGRREKEGEKAREKAESCEIWTRSKSAFAERFLLVQERRRREVEEKRDEEKRDEERQGEAKEGRRVLVFDTETTGLKGSVIQLAYLVCTGEGEEVEHGNWYLKTKERIEEGAKAVHKITEDVLHAKGEEPSVVLSRFDSIVKEERRRGTVFVAHNSAFDVARLSYTASVVGVSSPIRKGEVVCSMQAFKHRCRAKDRRGNVKNPRNEEVFHFLFGEAPSFPLHDAMGDVRVTMANWVEGTRRWGSL